MLGFAVDTHLLRELGELLVGRDSTAILELVKNGYDADASRVRITATDLADPAAAELIVDDDGNGMTLQRFREAFLRIAGRSKEQGPRESPRKSRAYTGQKGIGRLASQKLAHELEVFSVPDQRVKDNEGPGVRSRIDWAVIDQQADLNNLERGLEVQPVFTAPVNRQPGTKLTLRRLKREWTDSEISTFVNELQSAQPPKYLTAGTPEALGLSAEPLFGEPLVRTSSDADRTFDIEFEGDLKTGDDLWSVAAEKFDWCIEIDVRDSRVRYRVSPTVRLERSNPEVHVYNFEADAPADLAFQARIFFMPAATARRGPLQGFTRATSGVRIYQEGFRVLPYGELGNDWLALDREYRTGQRFYTIHLDDSVSDPIEQDKTEALSGASNANYYGAVFLTTAGAPHLESIVNREGFVPSHTFDAITRIVTNGVRLSVRVRRAVSVEAKRRAADGVPRQDAEDSEGAPDDQQATRQKEDGPSSTVATGVASTRPPAQDRAGYELLSPHPVAEPARDRIENAVTAAAEIRRRGDAVPEPAAIAAVADGLDAATAALDELESIQSELRTLASVGLQLGAFVHDINGMLSSTRSTRALLSRLAESFTGESRSDLRIILKSVEELAHTLARQSSYLTDVLSSDPRRRRSRLYVAERVAAVLAFLEQRVNDRGITVDVRVDETLRTPPMFPAELTALLTNILTNAVKNAEDKGHILVDARRDGSGNPVIVVANDGVAVDLDDAEKWFRPFETTTTVVDEMLGQGLGLGLPIVRAIADDYDSDVRFIRPPSDFATAIQVWLKEKER